MAEEIEWCFADEDEEADSSQVYGQFLKLLADGSLRQYKAIIQYSNEEDGGKEGQTYFSHVMDLVSVAERLRPLFQLTDAEMRCLILGIITHDINKIEPYSKESKYANAAKPAHIEQELEKLGVERFFLEWREYINDIVLIAHMHQETTPSTLLLQQSLYDKAKLDNPRLKGVLKSLIKVVDIANLSHSSHHQAQNERGLRQKVLNHINPALQNQRVRYRFGGHRLAELRGLFTNVIHKTLVDYFIEKYSALDLTYYPEGVNYLIDKNTPLNWDDNSLREVANRVEQRLATIQLEKISQFIKGRPAGIVVDDAAINSGATIEDIFVVISNVVSNKQYKSDWKEERNAFARKDLQTAFDEPKVLAEPKALIAALLQEALLVPQTDTALKRGEFAGAYRKFLEDHRQSKLKALKADTWGRVYKLFNLPEAFYPVYSLIDPYRRGYFIARDLPEISLDQMLDKALADLAELDGQETNSKNKPNSEDVQLELGLTPELPIPSGFIYAYLKRNLEIWDDEGTPANISDFKAVLRQYSNPKEQYEQCCYCGSSFQADEWMAAQVPPNIGVQSFSNRLEGGTSRDPKRNVCAVCRSQFILEKLAWSAPRDKQGAEQTTFYLHLFPYAFFTKPLLEAWWKSIQRLKSGDTTAFFLNPKRFYSDFNASWAEINGGKIKGYPTKVNGIGLPNISEAVSNTPILPIVAPGKNYHLQYMYALEVAVALVNWFECRAILSRLQIPPLNLYNERIGNKPVALLVEGKPRNLSWLLPETAYCRQSKHENASLVAPPHNFELLMQKISTLHQLAGKLYYPNSDSDALIMDFVTAAADDPLALYYEADRTIEKKVASERGKGGSPEHYAIYLTKEVAPFLKTLVGEEEKANANP